MSEPHDPCDRRPHDTTGGRASFRIEIESEVAVPAATLWNAVASMRGVNSELAPFLRMTGPRGGDLLVESNPAVAEGFVSWILLFGVVPVDRHRFSFEYLGDDRFSERSSSLLNRSWRHDRSVVSTGNADSQACRGRDLGGCAANTSRSHGEVPPFGAPPKGPATSLLRDVVVVVPRVGLVTPVVRLIVGAVFTWRHRRLRRRYGRV